MREALLSIDRGQNDELDFLQTQRLQLKPRDDGNYTEFIMEVINRAAHIGSDLAEDDPLQQTLFEKFTAFSENLFWLAQEDAY